MIYIGEVTEDWVLQVGIEAVTFETVLVCDI